MNRNRRTVLRILLVVLVCFAMTLTMVPRSVEAAPAKVPLDPLTIPKYVNTLTQMPPIMVPTKARDPQTGVMTDYYTIIATQFQQQILPAGFPKTTVWGYGGLAKDALTGQFLGFVRNSPSPSIVATRGTPCNIAWVNGIYTKYLFAVDPTIDWANPNHMPAPSQPVNAPPFPPGYAQAQYPVAIVTHLHGGENSPKYDGTLYQWWTWNGLHGPDYYTYSRTLPNAAVYHYTNTQMGGGLVWYHDHAAGLTRSNVYSGLAGGYLLIDPHDPVFPLLPFGKYFMPIIVQDRLFYTDGSLQFPSDAPPNPTIHPYWVPEFFGNTIMVNGKVWPKMNVDKGQYQFVLLEGSNARWYNMSFHVGALDGPILPMTLIGKDENYIRSAVSIDSVLMAPGERYQVLVDFTGIPAGTSVYLQNNAPSLPPSGPIADPNTVGQIMRFDVQNVAGFVPKTLPAILNPTLAGNVYPTLTPNAQARNLTLFEWDGPNGPQMVTIDGQTTLSAISELPKVGTTELWRIIDATPDAHPIHLHGVAFQFVSTQAYDQTNYSADWLALNGGVLPFPNATKNLNLNNYLIGSPTYATPAQYVWADDYQVQPGFVTTIIVRWAPADGSGSFPFDPTLGPPFVWHCHIVDHEDQDMLRQYRMVW